MTATNTIRYLCSELVRVTGLDGPQRPSQGGNLEELGESFAEILTECPFSRKARVRITSEIYQMDGIVESCAYQRSLGYVVRVKLAPSSFWSEQQFKPQHMLRVGGATSPKVSPLGMASGY